MTTPNDTPVFTEYLLKIATDAEELERLQASADNASATDYLTTHTKLSADQIDALSSNDSGRIVQAVIDELTNFASTDTPFCGTAIMLVVPCGNYIQHAHPVG